MRSGKRLPQKAPGQKRDQGSKGHGSTKIGMIWNEFLNEYWIHLDTIHEHHELCQNCAKKMGLRGTLHRVTGKILAGVRWCQQKKSPAHAKYLGVLKYMS